MAIIDVAAILKDKWDYMGRCCNGTQNYSYKSDGKLRIKVKGTKFDMFFKGRRERGARIISEWGKLLSELQNILTKYEL
jgi:hypothetical protein